MKARTLLGVLGLTAIGVCAAMIIRSANATRQHRKQDKDALSRWEGEGGPPPPDDAELSPAASRA